MKGGVIACVELSMDGDELNFNSISVGISPVCACSSFSCFLSMFSVLRMEPKEIGYPGFISQQIPFQQKMSPKSGSNVCSTYKIGDTWKRWFLPAPTGARISPEVIRLHPEQPKLWTWKNLFVKNRVVTKSKLLHSSNETQDSFIKVCNCCRNKEMFSASIAMTIPVNW